MTISPGNNKTPRKKKAQSSVEYLLLLGAVVVVVLVAFKDFIPTYQNETQNYFDMVGRGIYGPPADYYDATGNHFERLRIYETYP